MMLINTNGNQQFTPVLALYDPFGVDVPLNLDIPPPPPMETI